MNNSQSESGTLAPTNSDEARLRLAKEVGNARESLARLNDEYEMAVTDDGVIQEDRDAVRQMVDRARTTLTKATDALDRHDAGVYGICAKCGQPIGEERLEALPQISTCRACS